MPGVVPDSNFRIGHAFAATPDLTADDGPGRGLVVGFHGAGTSPDCVYLGKSAERPFKGVWLDVRGAHAIYVMGKRRSGKSYTLGALAEGLVAESWIRQGTDRQGVLILDTMNVYLTMPISVGETVREGSEQQREFARWRLAAERIPTVLFHPIGTSLPQGLAGEPISLRPSDLDADEWCALFEVDPFVDPMGHLLVELHGKVSADGYTDPSTGRRVPGTEQFRLDDLRRCLGTDPDLQRYPRETREALSRRLDAVRRLPVFSDEGLDIRRLLRPGQLSVLLLRDLDPNLRAVMIALIVKRMLRLRSVSEQYERMLRVHVARANASRATDPGKAASEEALAAECRRRATSGLPRS